MLKADHNKKITINNTSLPYLALVNKLSGITLRVTSHINDLLFKKLFNNVTYSKALELDLLCWPTVDEKLSIKKILTQIQQLEVLKIVHHSYEENSSYQDHFLIELLQEFPAYAYLKELYINAQAQALEQWDTLLKVLPYFKKLEVVPIEGSRPNTTKQFFAFTQILQTLYSLKKLIIHAPLNEQESIALTELRSTLKNLHKVFLIPCFISQTADNTIAIKYMSYSST